MWILVLLKRMLQWETTSSITSSGFAVLYDTMVRTHTQTATSIHSNDRKLWEVELPMPFLSSLIWCIAWATFGAIAFAHMERVNAANLERHRQERMQYIRNILTTKTIYIPPIENNENVTTENENETDETRRSSIHSCCVPMSTTAPTCGCCSICLEDFQHGDTICQSSSCCHIFHLEGCMSKWLLRHDDCPYCRARYLVDEEGDTDDKQQHKRKRLTYVKPVASSIDNNITQSSSLSHHPHSGDPGRYVGVDVYTMEDLPPWLTITAPGTM